MAADIWREAYDPETGMATLPAFLEHVGHAMRRLRRSPLTLAVLSTHADQLVPRQAGARTARERALLVQTAQRLHSAIRPGDVVARIEESSFSVLCEDLASYDHAVGVALRLLEELDQPLEVEGESAAVDLRFGVAFPVGDEQSPRSVVERSVEAMRAARFHPTRRYDVILGSSAPDADVGSSVIDLDALERRLRPRDGSGQGPDDRRRRPPPRRGR